MLFLVPGVKKRQNIKARTKTRKDSKKLFFKLCRKVEKLPTPSWFSGYGRSSFVAALSIISGLNVFPCGKTGFENPRNKARSESFFRSSCEKTPFFTMRRELFLPPIKTILFSILGA